MIKSEQKEQGSITSAHSNVFIEDRNSTNITGVEDVVSFNENEMVVLTNLGLVLITGKNLIIEKLDVTTKELWFKGTVISLVYANKKEEKKGLFKKIFN